MEQIWFMADFKTGKHFIQHVANQKDIEVLWRIKLTKFQIHQLEVEDEITFEEGYLNRNGDWIKQK